MQKIGWFGVVGRHPISLAIPSFDRAHTTYRFRDIARHLSKVADSAFGAPVGVTPVEFRGDLWRQKTRVPDLSCGIVFVIPCVAVLVEFRLVTDTDRHRRTQAHGW